MRILFLILLSVVLLASCVTEKKAVNYMRTHPEKLAEMCANTFPPKIEYRPGKPIYKTDSIIEIRIDTVKVTVDCPDGTKVDADCPPNKTITKTIRDSVMVTDTLEVISTQMVAKLADMEYKLSASKTDLGDMIKDRDKYKEKSSEKGKWNWILGGVLTLLVGIKLVRFFKVI